MNNVTLSSVNIHEVYVRTSEAASKDHDYIAFNVNVQSDSIANPLEVGVQATRYSDHGHLSFGMTDSQRSEEFESIVKDGENSSTELYRELMALIDPMLQNAKDLMKIRNNLKVPIES